ncbi:MAG: hypothetical protein LWX83_08430 [Anaerolineae bacterium]|nr:hypothetical protein [Anaerolineae bacterium]
MKKYLSIDTIMPVILLVMAVSGVILAVILQNRPEKAAACPQSSSGVYGPIQIIFNQAVSPASVEGQFSLSPVTEGHFEWSQNTLNFWPNRALNPNQTYYLNLAGGQTSSGKTIQAVQNCRISIRSPRIIFEDFKPAKNVRLRLTSLDGKLDVPLASFSNEILSFKASGSGNFVVLAVANNKKGSDIWLLSADGKTNKKLVDCGEKRCDAPLWSFDDLKIIYRQQSVADTQDKSYTYWQIDPSGMENKPLFEQPVLSGSVVSFSPDGKKLVMYDETQAGIRLINLATGENLLLKSNSAVLAWSPDSNRLIYFNQVQEHEQTYLNALLYDCQTNQSHILLDQYRDEFEFGEPVWSPDGEWITMAVRLARVQGSPTKQIMLLKIDGSVVKSITDDQLYTYSVYSWSPDGESLLFQRYRVGSSNMVPDILLWEKETNRTRVLINGGGRPAWLP